MVCPRSRLLLSNKIHSCRRDLKGIVLSERSHSQKITSLYDSTYMAFWKRHSCNGREQASGSEEGDDVARRSGRGLFGVRDLFGVLTMVGVT